MEVTHKIRDAQSALTKAGKVWKRAESVLEVMEAYNRKRLLARVLDKEEPRTSDIGKAIPWGTSQPHSDVLHCTYFILVS